MAGLFSKINSGEISLTAAVAKTLLQIVAPSNHRLVVKGLWIMLKGTSATDTPVKYRITRQTTAGTATAGVVGTHISKGDNGYDETLQTTVQVNFTAEPTTGDILEFGAVHPQTGFRVLYPLEMPMIIPGGTRLGIELTAVQAQTAVCGAEVEE